MKNKLRMIELLAAIVLAGISTACEGVWDVPITDGPTQKIDARLLGDWKEKDGNDMMKVRKYDESVYIISFGGDLYRAYHSSTAKFPFMTVQDIDSPSRKYMYFVYRLSADGATLELRPVDEKTIAKTAKTSAEVQGLLEQHARDPKLFEEKGEFVRQK